MHCEGEIAVEKLFQDVIIRPVISEKSYANSDRRQYTFVIPEHVNRVEVKQAIEKLFDVKVVSVNTLHRMGKVRRLPNRTFGKRTSEKRAIVTLAPDQQLDIFTNGN
ncbi:MAG: 50S ribosomal protein L23 [Aeriscardovia sp.]|nr:50S ribosomal protein L23 [Aeriscardovia sp.]